MACCRGQNYDQVFGAKAARRELRRYRKRGPRGATARLLALLRQQGAAPRSLLDIGGGVGTIQHEMLRDGLAHVTSVDASAAYLEATRRVAAENGYGQRWQGIEGDFVDLAAQIESADVVTLDKVICCYPDMHALVRRSASKAQTLYGIVVPTDGWGMRALAPVANLAMRIARFEFRAFIHRHAAIDAAAATAGLRLKESASYWVWSVRVYARSVS